MVLLSVVIIVITVTIIIVIVIIINISYYVLPVTHLLRALRHIRPLLAAGVTTLSPWSSDPGAMSAGACAAGRVTQAEQVGG